MNNKTQAVAIVLICIVCKGLSGDVWDKKLVLGKLETDLL
jgi:hypothetical protein